MKLFHLSDLHLGKTVNGFSMLDDQRYILTKIINIIDEEKPTAILIAGDVYDRSVPPADAVIVFDDFLNRLAARKIETFIISGNHDSPERNAFASKLIDQSGIHFSQVYNGKIEPFILEDEHGKVNIYMLPFIKPVVVADVFKEKKVKTYTDAVELAIKKMNINPTERNVLVTHQFVTGATRSDSEEKSLGGSDNVDADIFDIFDYVALGHIHRPQQISPKIRYSGSPLKYSFSEMDYEKSVTIIELDKKGIVEVRTAPLVPEKDMQQIKGKFDELVAKEFYKNLKTDDYFRVILTDENDVLDALAKLRIIYPNIMTLEYDNSRTRSNSEILHQVKVDDLSPLEIFADFYQKQNGKDMEEEQKTYITSLIKDIWENKK